MGDNIYLGDRNGVRTPMQWNGGLERGFLRRRSGAALLAADFKSGLWLPGDQRGCARTRSEHSMLALDEKR